MAADDDRPPVPEGLLARLRADPAHAPETTALAAAEHHAPAAASWVQAKRARYASQGRDLAVMAKKRHAAYARFEGAATGVGGVLTVLPDLVALAWIQSRLVFFVAAAFGHDPHDPMRPAELLVIQGLYADRDQAREALDGVGRSIARAYVDQRTSSQDEALVRRLARFVGRRAANRVAGRLIPGVAIFVNAASNGRDTQRLADRAMDFYEGLGD